MGSRRGGALFFLWLGLLQATGAVRASEASGSYPLSDCVEADQRSCVARFFANDSDRERRNCFPARYLELWNPDVLAELESAPAFLRRADDDSYRRVTAAECGVSPKFLAPLARRMACLDPQTCPSTPERPQLGVALEGGGSKSAPFALGVLAGLQRAGLLERVDVVASVSGGSYAAHYYFSRLMDSWEARQAGALGAAGSPDDWFVDCVPKVYEHHFSETQKSSLRICPKVENDDGRSADGSPACAATRSATSEGTSSGGDTMRQSGVDDAWLPHYQSFMEQVVHYPDLIYPVGSWRRASGIIDNAGAAVNVLGLFALHLVTVPAHHLAHTVFSWPENFAPSREAYRAGIERAYGHTPATWRDALDKGPNWLPAGSQEEPHSMCDPVWKDEAEPIRRRGSHNLARLGCAYRDARARRSGSGAAATAAENIPLWITGSANTAGRSLSSWLTTPDRDALRLLFETSPLGQGSGTFGWADVPFGRWLLRDAAGASAAFLDDEQREFGKPPLRTLMSFGLHLFNLNWGTDIPNFAVWDER